MGETTFPEAFAAALTQRGVSLAWLHHRLVERGHPVSPAALSYWRSGRSQPERGTSRDALGEIERLLRLAPDSLTSKLGPSRRPGPRPGEKSVREVFADTPGVQDALEALDFEGLYDELAEQLRHITVDLDASGHATTVLIRAIMQARRDGARRTPLVVTLDGAGFAPRFVPVAGCALGREHTDLASGVFAAELLVDRPLAHRETCMFELRIELSEPSRETWFDHYAARRISELLVWVRFDAARRPATVERYTRIDSEEESEVVPLGDATGVHALARGFGPGILGIRWEW